MMYFFVTISEYTKKAVLNEKSPVFIYWAIISS